MKSRTIILDEIGDLHAEPGSRKWAIAVKGEIETALRRLEFSGEQLETWMRMMEERRGYASLGFSTIDAFCETPAPRGLGTARKAKTPNPFDTVATNLGQLTRPELEELADMVAALLACRKREEEREETEDVEGEEAVEPIGRNARGHVELKRINGCGPYAYLRYWSGGHLRSKYIGKVKK